MVRAVAVTQLLFVVCLALNRAENRYSFSLSTFDREGKLGQVERAVEAAAQGAQLVAVITNSNEVIMAATSTLPSPLILEDGTKRFASLTPLICIAHSGIGPDGRVVVSEAQRLAVEYKHLYDEDIPIDILLQELSLLYQEYTMKAGARPFGASVLIAYKCPASDRSNSCFFNIDPSGSVSKLDRVVTMHGDLDRFGLKDRLSEVVEMSDPGPVVAERLAQEVLKVLKKSMEATSMGESQLEKESLFQSIAVKTAYLSASGVVLNDVHSTDMDN